MRAIATLHDLTTFLATLPEQVLVVLEGPGSGWLEGEEAWQPFVYFDSWEALPAALTQLLAQTVEDAPC